jgi:hypothetical protein
MKGEELLKSAIGKKLESGKVQSFCLKNRLVDQINVTFLKFDQWIKIVSSEEITELKLEENSIEQIEFYGDDEFKYPINPIEIEFPEFRKYIGKVLLDYKELVWENNESLSFGVNLYFEEELNFLIYNNSYQDDRNEYNFENRVPEDLKEK